MNIGFDINAKPSRYRAVTLDMGYTLVNLTGGFDQELIHLGARHGRKITPDDVRTAMRATWEMQSRRDATATWAPSPDVDEAMALEIDRHICRGLGLDDPRVHAEAHAIAWRLFHDPSCFPIFPDVWDTLEALRSTGVTLGIISNWGWHLPDLCAELGLSPYFDFIISSARVGAAKPHPAIFQAALRQARCDPVETLHVGDSLTADVLGAQAAGIAGILLDRSCPGTARNGYDVVCSLGQVLEYVS
jgi:putative hydrolase of the HAD superfamily